jgi:hypothetical protein
LRTGIVVLDRTTTDEQRRARKNRSLKEHRARTRKGLGLAGVVYDGAMLNLLVRHRYIDDKQTSNKRLVGAAMHQMLYDVAHDVKNSETGCRCPHCGRLLFGA